ILGLDSNNVSVGPNVFPVGVRVSNTGNATATNVRTDYGWDSANSFINLNSATTIAMGSLAPGASVDAYYNVAVTRNASAYPTARRYHATATADGLSTVSTPTPRELYIEHLVSQNRNAVDGISGAQIVNVGQTYQYVLNSHTAPGGYQQLESFLTL